MEMLINSQDTLSAVELDIGDELKYVRENGEAIVISILSSDSGVIETSLQDTRIEKPEGGTTLWISCDITVNGHPLTLRRFLCVQESFYQPIIINGVCIWLDGVKNIFDHIIETHGECRPKKAVRFALHEISKGICPEKIYPWCPLEGETIDVGDNYGGDDCFMGPYWGASAHGGLDINHPAGTPLWAPIDFDFHYLFDSVEKGMNNNRWRGVRRFSNGDLWILQVHHLIKLHQPELTPMKHGTLMADAAGVRVGNHNHSHFVFCVVHDGDKIMLDPWILFWQTFETRRIERNKLTAIIEPFCASQTGAEVIFKSKSINAKKLRWTFGDKTLSDKDECAHVFLKPGIYPVTLTVTDFNSIHSVTHYITVHGNEIKKPVIQLDCDECFSYNKVGVNDVYPSTPKTMPYTLRFVLPEGQRGGVERTINISSPVNLINISCKCVPENPPVKVCIDREKNQIIIRVNAKDMKKNLYKAQLDITADNADEQTMDIEIDIREKCSADEVVVDIKHEGFYCTPYYWVGHKFAHWPKAKGYNNFYLLNGYHDGAGEYSCFTPYLSEGEYDVCFHSETPVMPDTYWEVTVKHKDGKSATKINPSESLYIGRYSFAGGCEGYVRINGANTVGSVCVNAVCFKRVQ